MKKSRMILGSIIACALWASAFPTLKALYKTMGVGDDVGIKLLLAGIRFSISGLLILIFYTVLTKKLPKLESPSMGFSALTLGIIQTGLLYFMFYIGVYHSTGIKSAILTQTSIFMVVIASHFIYHNDKMTREKAIGLMLGIGGVILVNVGGLSKANNLLEFSLVGEGFLLFAGLFSAIGTFYAKKLSKSINPILLNGWQMSFGGLLLLGVGLILVKEPVHLLSSWAPLLMVFLILISSGAFTLWFILLQKNKASELAMMRFLIPILGSVLSALLIPGESFTLMIFVALLLVALGIYLCNAPKKRA